MLLFYIGTSELEYNNDDIIKYLYINIKYYFHFYTLVTCTCNYMTIDLTCSKLRNKPIFAIIIMYS